MEILKNYGSTIGQTNRYSYQAAKKEEKAKEDVVDTYETSGQKEALKATYDRPKKLTEKQIEQIKQKQEESKIQMLKQMTYANVSNQSKLMTNGKSNDLLTSIFGSVENALPKPATTPEGAAQAIAPGGAYSVEAVTDRIMKMAYAIAGDNPEKIEEMQKAVKEGFKQAGLDIESGKGLPSICYDTYKATMEKFESWKAKNN